MDRKDQKTKRNSRETKPNPGAGVSSDHTRSPRNRNRRMRLAGLRVLR